MPALTVIGKANELIESHGTEYAIDFFQKLIDEIGDPNDFQGICKKSGYETAIKHIKGEIK
jgi:hypothetical protein